MSSEKYAAVLEAAEQTLSEGEYLRVANLLKELNNASIKDGEVVRVEKTIINSNVSWETILPTDVAMVIHISEKEHQRIRGPHPDKIYYVGTIDDKPFKMEYAELEKKIKQLMWDWGVRKINRECSGRTRVFDNWAAFKRFASDIIGSIDPIEDGEADYNFFFLCQMLLGICDGFD